MRETRRDAPGSFALIAEAYFKKYGLTYEQGKTMLAKIDVKNHFNGSLSPKAHFHNVITMEQVMNAPLIASRWACTTAAAPAMVLHVLL